MSNDYERLIPDWRILTNKELGIPTLGIAMIFEEIESKLENTPLPLWARKVKYQRLMRHFYGE